MRQQLPPPPVQPQISVTRTKSAVNVNIIATGVVFLTIFGLCVITSFRDSLAVAVLWTGRALAAWVAGWALVKIASGAVGVWHKAKTYGLERKILEAELDEKNAQIWQHNFMAIGQYGMIGHNPNDGKTIIIEPVKNGFQPATPAPLAVALPEPMQHLMDVISPEPCVLIYGRRNSGKTTTAMQWLASRPGRKIVIDIKPRGENVWPAGCEVFGNNDNIGQVKKALDIAAAEFGQRKGRDFMQHPPMTIFVDELYYLYNVRGLDIFETFWEIVALGRSYNMHGGLTSSGKEVDLLGAKGKGSIRDNLAFVRLKLVGSTRYCYVDLGDGEIETQHPGPYHAATLPPLSDEERILAAAFNGASYRAISEAVGLGNGGNVNKRIADTLTAGGWVYDGDKGWYQN